MRKLCLFFACWLLASTQALAQNVVVTSVTGSIAAPALYETSVFTVTDGTGINAGFYLLIDQEVMAVVAMQGNTVTARRSAGGLPGAHTAGATVYAGPINLFQQDDPSSMSCIASASQAPWMNLKNGHIYICSVLGLWQSLNAVPPSGVSGTFLLSGGINQSPSWASSLAGLTLTSPFLAANGTVAAPSIAFSATPSLGFYRQAATAIGVAFSSAERFRFAGSTSTFNALIYALGGTIGSPDALLASTGAGQPRLSNAAATVFFNVNLSGAPVLSACNDGALATGSTNTSGRVTSAATMVGCTLTFSTAFPNNSADCQIENLVANRGNVTAASTSAFTVANLTAGDDFMYFCVGR